MTIHNQTSAARSCARAHAGNCQGWSEVFPPLSLSPSLSLSLSLSLSPSLSVSLSLFFLRFAVVHTKKRDLHAAACGRSVHHRMENCRDHQTNLNIIQNIQMASRFLRQQLPLYTSRKSVLMQKLAALPHHSMCARVLLHLHLVRSIIYLFELEAVSLRSPSGCLLLIIALCIASTLQSNQDCRIKRNLLHSHELYYHGRHLEAIHHLRLQKLRST